MSDLEKLKAERRKELLAILESKKKELQIHFDEGANKAIDVSKGMMVAGAAVFVLYTIFDRYLESKFRNTSSATSTSSGKSAATKFMYPIFSMVLQEGASLMFNQGQKILNDFIQKRKLEK